MSDEYLENEGDDEIDEGIRPTSLEVNQKHDSACDATDDDDDYDCRLNDCAERMEEAMAA